jgi:gamma-glutamylputrescine oxidase
MTFNAGLSFGNSYYLATADAAPNFPPLAGDAEADLVVVGGGCTGLSAALHAAERGLEVVLLEGGHVGWGASGRNGGQIIPGLRKGAAELVAAYGVERARALFDLALEARALVVDLIARHAIDCDLRLTGHLAAAVKPRDFAHMRAEAQSLVRDFAYPHAELLSAAEVRRLVDVPYAGGLFDRGGGHFHTLNYTLGLARAAKAAGVIIHADTLVTDVTQAAKLVTARTGTGHVRARHAILAADALLAGVAPAIEHRIMPVANYVVATAPLPFARELIPSDAAVSDSRFVVDYYRLTPDGRLLFGGGERYSRSAPPDIAAFVRPHLEGVFPRLKGVAIDHAWGGLVSITLTRLPHFGREGKLLYAHGYSGMGAILSTLAGKLMADALTGGSEGFDLFAGVAPPAFPGGAALRSPLHVLGMLWYALRDRL